MHNTTPATALSEDLLPGVSVVDLKVVDFDASIGDRLHGNLKLGLLLKWAQMKYLIQLGW